MRVELLKPNPGYNFVNPTIRFDTRIEHNRGKEAIIQVNGWVKTEADIYISPLTELLESDQRKDELAARGTYHDRNNYTNTHHLILTTQLNEKSLKYVENERTKNKKKDVVLKIELNIAFLESDALISHVHMLDTPQFKLPYNKIPTNTGREIDFKIMAYAYDREYSSNTNNGWILSGNNSPSFLSVHNQKISYRVTIPSSDWINDYAPIFGLGNYLIIEIPTGSETISDAWAYVKKADIAYMNWDSKSVYANCRECGRLLNYKMQEKYGEKGYISEERWGSCYKRFNHLSSIDLHLEEKIAHYPDEKAGG